MTNGGTVSCYAGSDGDFVQMFENGTNSNYHEAGHQFSGKLLFWVIGSNCLCQQNNQNLRIFNVDLYLVRSISNSG